MTRLYRFSLPKRGEKRYSSGMSKQKRSDYVPPKPLPLLENETTKEYAERLVAGWPLPTEEQRRLITRLLYGGPEYASSGPSDYEMAQYRKAREREDAIKSAKKLAESMTACDVCNLQPDVHHLRRAQGIDMHEWQPGRAEKLMRDGRAK